MAAAHWNRRFTDSTRGRIAALLRAEPLTVDELAAKLKLTGNAVRAHVVALEADGLVHRAGQRTTASKPSVTYALTSHAETQYSGLYLPFLSRLLRVLDEKMSPREFDGVMRRAGRALLAGRAHPDGTPADRVHAASELLNSFGGMTRVERVNAYFVVRSAGCPFTEATAQHPEACNAVESLLAEFTGLPVEKCCERGERMRCCFEISAQPRAPKKPTAKRPSGR
jgi:DeoR family transcriptional regulator, suf operon transcriptional repressor